MFMIILSIYQTIWINSLEIKLHNVLMSGAAKSWNLRKKSQNQLLCDVEQKLLATCAQFLHRICILSFQTISEKMTLTLQTTLKLYVKNIITYNGLYLRFQMRYLKSDFSFGMLKLWRFYWSIAEIRNAKVCDSTHTSILQKLHLVITLQLEHLQS